MYHTNKWYLAIYNKRIYRVHSWVKVLGSYEISRSNKGYYNADGSILDKYAKCPVYLSLNGITIKPK